MKIAGARGLVDLGKTLNDYQEWRVAASRGPAWVQGVVYRYGAIFLETESDRSEPYSRNI